MTNYVMPLALACGACLCLYVALIVAHAVKALGERLLDTLLRSARLAGEAAGIAAAWPVEMGMDRIERLVARGAEWRARRRIWRTEFKGRLSWNEFEKQMSGNQPVRDELADALGLLALKEPFTRAELDTRFKRTMAAVHPDRGGSEHLARLANEARALILKRKDGRNDRPQNAARAAARPARGRAARQARRSRAHVAALRLRRA